VSPDLAAVRATTAPVAMVAAAITATADAARIVAGAIEIA
jgi:hypothetical protein